MEATRAKVVTEEVNTPGEEIPVGVEEEEVDVNATQTIHRAQFLRPTTQDRRFTIKSKNPFITPALRRVLKCYWIKLTDKQKKNYLAQHAVTDVL